VALPQLLRTALSRLGALLFEIGDERSHRFGIRAKSSGRRVDLRYDLRHGTSRRTRRHIKQRKRESASEIAQAAPATRNFDV
ncbi:MAG: hypothetical protein DIU63_14190, partial [Proteobacteria bacterium]